MHLSGQLVYDLVATVVLFRVRFYVRDCRRYPVKPFDFVRRAFIFRRRVMNGTRTVDTVLSRSADRFTAPLAIGLAKKVV